MGFSFFSYLFWGTHEPCDFRRRRVRTRKTGKKSQKTLMGRVGTNLWALLDLSGKVYLIFDITYTLRSAHIQTKVIFVIIFLRLSSNRQ
jgi:hypothetical protein